MSTIKLSLCMESVDIASEKIVEFLEHAKVNHDTVIQNRLFAEEVILGWLEHEVAENFTVRMGYRFKTPYVSIEAAGHPFNLFDSEKEDGLPIMTSLLRSMGKLPVYSYKNGRNTVLMTFPAEQKNKLFTILTSIAVAVLVGTLLRLVLQENGRTVLLSDFIDPLYSTAFRVLGYISGPLILLSVMWGIYGIGDATTFGQIGKKLLLRFVFIILIIAFAGLAFLPVFQFTFQKEAENSSAFKAIFEMILDIVPPNIIQPLISGNTLQLIFSAVIIGIAMLFLGKRVDAVADLVEQINCIVQFLMGFISDMMPYFIFLIILRLILNNTLSIFGSVWKLFVLFLCGIVILCSIFTAVTSLKFKVSPLKIIRKSIPTFLIAITTASSAAAFSSNMETCEKKFGVDKSLCSFGIPLGMVMFKTSTTLYYLLVSFFFAKQCDVSVSIAWVFSAAFISAMLAIATPPIPGGGAAAYTMLFAKLGIPTDALAVVLSMDILFDFVRTAINMYNLPLELINTAGSIGKLNTDKLRQ